MIKISDVYFKYNEDEDEKYALRGINLDIKKDELECINK